MELGRHRAEDTTGLVVAAVADELFERTAALRAPQVVALNAARTSSSDAAIEKPLVACMKLRCCMNPATPPSAAPTTAIAIGTRGSTKERQVVTTSAQAKISRMLVAGEREACGLDIACKSGPDNRQNQRRDGRPFAGAPVRRPGHP